MPVRRLSMRKIVDLRRQLVGEAAWYGDTPTEGRTVRIVMEWTCTKDS